MYVNFRLQLYIKPFFYILKAQLLDYFNYSYRIGSLSGTQLGGLISQFLKQDPDGKDKVPVYIKKGPLHFNVVMQMC